MICLSIASFALTYVQKCDGLNITALGFSFPTLVDKIYRVPQAHVFLENTHSFDFLI